MEQDTVIEIIAVEKEIHRKVEAERQRWQSWLAEAGKRAESQYETELAALDKTAAEERRRAAEEAEKKASALIAEAEQEYAGWRNIPDPRLEKIVGKHLENAITGGPNDSPDVEN